MMSGSSTAPARWCYRCKFQSHNSPSEIEKEKQSDEIEPIDEQAGKHTREALSLLSCLDLSFTSQNKESRL